jgi:hypothetical protein
MCVPSDEGASFPDGLVSLFVYYIFAVYLCKYIFCSCGVIIPVISLLASYCITAGGRMSDFVK